MTKINQDEFKIFSKYIKDISGIFLDESKAYLPETRLKTILDQTGCTSYAQLCARAKADATKSLEKKIVDAISTNETLFFRDSGPFELLQHKILPELIDRRSEKAPSRMPIPIRIWSAACSSGQEVYSISIVLKELLPDFSKYNIRLLGTDISDAAISQASYGAYSKFEIERGLTREKLQKYFTPNADRWKIKDEIRAMANFNKVNLLSPLLNPGKFDIVFCRNVAIYFSLDDRKALFNKIADFLEKDGYLIVGSTESLTGVCAKFEPKRHLRSIFYQLRG